MKKIIKMFSLVIFTIVLVAFVSSCGKKESGTPAEKNGENVSTTENVSGEEQGETNEEEMAENEEQEEAVAGAKFDQKLQEAIEHAEKGGVNPNFAVDAILTGSYNDAMVSKLEGMGVDVVYGDKNTLRIVVSPKVLKEIENVDFIKKFVLITENYYPNR